MTSTRTDVHKPSTAEPADYRQLGVFYQGSSDDEYDAYSADIRELEENLIAHYGPCVGGLWLDALGVSGSIAFDGWHQRSAQCDCCGARFAHGAAYLHVPTNKVICVGHDCANNLFSFSDRNAAIRSREVKVAKERKALAAKKDKFLAVPENAEAVAYLTARVESGPWSTFNNDVLAKFHRYGDLSEKQVAAVLRGRDRDAEKANEPPEFTAPVIEGRITVTGVVLSTKLQDGYLPGQEVLKMLVKDDRGFKVWGSVPSSIWGVQKGNRVTFAAAVTKSDNDETFGFFKRPTKAIATAGPEDESANV